MPELGVNIDHIATLRQQRKISFPDPVKAALICEKSGADSVVCHLREDRRHIQDSDVYNLRKKLTKKFNLEMSTAEEIVRIAINVKPEQATLVPEKRKELTTEGGLDVLKYKVKVARVVERLLKNGIFVSLFIDPDIRQIEAAKDVGAPFIEIHTGTYAEAKNAIKRQKELKKIKESARYASCIGLRVNAGHGLDYKNVKPIANIPQIEELNIGFSIISRAVFVGIGEAVKEMKSLISSIDS